MEYMILLGLGGHAHSVVDSIERGEEYNIIGFLDTQRMQGKRYKDYRVLDTDDALQKYFDSGIKNAFVTIGFMGHGMVRNRLYQRLKDIGYNIPNIIDKTADVSGSAKLGDGNFIGKQVVINASAEIGSMCIINTGAVVEHDCRIGSFSHLAVKSVLCGNVQIGAETLIGANAAVIQNIEIGRNVVVGAGTVVNRNIQDNMLRYGLTEKQREIEDCWNGQGIYNSRGGSKS